MLTIFFFQPEDICAYIGGVKPRRLLDSTHTFSITQTLLHHRQALHQCP
jgi:hypothetical protein